MSAKHYIQSTVSTRDDIFVAKTVQYYRQFVHVSSSKKSGAICYSLGILIPLYPPLLILFPYGPKLALLLSTFMTSNRTSFCQKVKRRSHQ